MDMEKNTGRKPGKTGLFGLGLALVLLLALIIGCAGGAFGLLKDSSSGVTAEYTLHIVRCEVETSAEPSGTVYSVRNTGTTPSYFRAVVAMNWTDPEAKTVAYLSEMPLPAISLSEGWTKDGEYYYCDKAVKPGDSCAFFSVAIPGDSDYQLQITVVADAIQSEPATAVAEAWGHSPGNR